MPKTAIEHWQPVITGDQVDIDEELTLEQRVDRIELILDEMSRDLTNHGGGNVRRRPAILHLLKQRGWVRHG